MSILVIGGTRFIGPAVVRCLAEQGAEVTLFNRGKASEEKAPKLPAGVATIAGDRRDLTPEVIAKLKAVEPEVVVDMVCVTEEDARSMVDVFAGVARRYVLVSSCDVYRAYGILIGADTGEPELEPSPLTEDSPLRRELYPYRGAEPRPEDDPRRILDDYDKIPAERLVLEHPELEGVVLRLPMVYGPGDYQRRLREYITQIDDGATEITLAETLAAWRDCRGYVEDVAHAIALAALSVSGAGRVYNVAEEGPCTQLDWVRRIAAAADWDGEIKVVPDAEMGEDGQPGFNARQHLDVDSARIRKELGYVEPTDPALALKASIAWEREQD